MALAQGAGKYVAWAVATGLLIKPDRCKRCGADGLIEAAHADYGRPLDVEWLCRPCHRLWDRETPKTMPKLGMVVFEEPEPSPNGDKDDGQEPGLEGGTGDGDGPGLE